MTKKIATSSNNIAAALVAAGVTAGDIVVTPAAPAAASVDAQQQQQQQPAPAPATNPTSADAAIAASSDVQQEIAEAKRIWEHARAGGISRQQFEYMCSSNPAKEAFLKQHKKAIFGSKKNQLAEAAQAVIDANINVIASGGGEKSKKEKKSVDEKEKAIRKVFGDRKNHKVPSKGELKKADVVLGVF